MGGHRALICVLALSFLLFDRSNGMGRHGKGYGECETNLNMYHKAYPAQTIQIPIDHFHNETRYEPHLNGTFANRYWFDATYYKPGGPVIVEQKGEDPYTYVVDLRVGLLQELARATNGLAVIFEHRYYGSNPVAPVKYLKDFRFLSVEQAMADQAYFAQNVVFPGLEDYDLTSPNTPWFAIGGSYPGAFTAWIRIQYPDVFWGGIASSAVTALKENYWEYYDVVREYSPPECVDTFGKMIDMADNILLGDNETEIMEFKSLFRYAGVNGSNAEFAYWNLNFPYSLQGKNWIPCLQRYAYLKGCRELNWPTLLYPNIANLTSRVKAVVDKSRWASESDRLTLAWLNYLGDSNYYHEVNSTASSERRSIDPGRKFYYSEDWLSWQYQQCTELGLFITGDNPKKDILPIMSRTQTLHFVKNMECRLQTYIPLNETHGPYKLNNYGGYNISYDRLMFTGGEADPWRPATQLATRDDEPTRLNYSSTLDQPWYLIPNASHVWDLEGVFPNQTLPDVPPPGIIEVHRLEKEALLRWLGEWRDAYSKPRKP